MTARLGSFGHYFVGLKTLIQLTVSCPADLRDILIAQLGELAFDSFLETDEGFIASSPNPEPDRARVEQLLNEFAVSFSYEEVPKVNWNEEWEKNVEPVWIDPRCLIRASFHEAHPEVPYEIIITPRMSFGTGHHPTTQLMLLALLDVDCLDKRVIDAGCGTGVLSVLASKRGAAEIEAFDIDDWSVDNATENVTVNHCSSVRIRKGTVDTLDFKGRFHIVLANINKNVLLGEMHAYSALLSQPATFLLSGFFEADSGELVTSASSHGFRELGRYVREDWCCLRLIRP
jgi:ribosomal protein L11 methyltransferase